ncbi:hypothetical protein [Helicobacter pylori]|uniref:hypothetical protein n=1 Tax=Helicobacter pylori TaxID=210 RepID=UPI001F61B651|nr:hypothetical protein [Helicobacter pylori]
MRLVAPYENDFTIFELLHCIDFQACNFERQQKDKIKIRLYYQTPLNSLKNNKPTKR